MKKGAQCAENLMIKLTDKIGRQNAHELLKQLSSEENFIKAVKRNETISEHLSEKEIETILDPSSYVGIAVQIVENLVSSNRK